eukprot:gene3568-biopygen17236
MPAFAPRSGPHPARAPDTQMIWMASGRCARDTRRGVTDSKSARCDVWGGGELPAGGTADTTMVSPSGQLKCVLEKPAAAITRAVRDGGLSFSNVTSSTVQLSSVFKVPNSSTVQQFNCPAFSKSPTVQQFNSSTVRQHA